MAETVEAWKERLKKEAAKTFDVSPLSIMLVPKNSKRGIRATWQKLGLVRCPVNRKEYRAYWARTAMEFKQGKRLNA